MTLLKDLIHIPERVYQGDFVLKLSDGVAHAERTLRDYVVTPQLVDAFGNALGFIEQAVATNTSKAAYLHGSFGAGKSHFMAVLNLLLAGNLQARALPDLAKVVASNGWTSGRKFLLVPYHMVGARDMESAVLGQYAEFVRKQHPEAPVPGFYLADKLFHDARGLRSQLGDDAFFAGLNQGMPDGQAPGMAGSSSGWGALDAGWDAARFEAALLEPPHGEERARLVGDLIRTFYSAYTSLAGSRESYVSFDTGLGIMSRHASNLGYDAVILFLDELVLWLASHAADAEFVSREGTKLVKLVEATQADRPIPLVSFVARQRDLRDLVGENLSGMVQVNFGDVLKHWEARFHRITLEDRNLPAIAEKRVLRPVNEAARQTLQATFDDLLKMRREVLDTLLTTTADRDMFRKVYPFSPALVETLIAVSAALQRERTALRLMQQLLVDRRDDLELGQLIPVGDLYDAIVEGDEPFSEDMRLRFENTKRLYSQRLLPMLERQHGVTWAASLLVTANHGQADQAAARNLRNDARLLKTLLLAELVPNVEALRGLTAHRLAALNHGSIRSPIPGREGPDVLRKCRDWAGNSGEIKISEDQVISIHVTGVDIESIVRAAELNDNVGNRRKRIREALFSDLDLPDNPELFTTFEFNWRGTKRTVDLLFENVWDLGNDRLRARDNRWTVVLGNPVHDGHLGPTDALAHLDKFRGDTHTLVWLPSTLSQKAESDLRRLVILDHLLQGDRFDNHAAHLSLVDRTQARALAKNQRDQLRIKLRTLLEVAYGVSTDPRDAVTAPLPPDQQFRSLTTTLAPRPPVGADFRAAFNNLLGQLLAHQYPAHPEFEIDIRVGEVKKIWAEVQKALDDPGHRWLVQDTKLRKPLRAVMSPCRLGQLNAGDQYLMIVPTWQEHFAQCHARDGGGPITVGRLRGWIDVPTPMGLPKELQDLIILTWATSTNRRFVRRGGPFNEAGIDNLPDEVELREQALPDAGHWKTALQRAAGLFGLTPPQMLNAANAARLADDLRQAAAQRRDAVRQLAAELHKHSARYGAAGGARQQTAESAQSLLAALRDSTTDAIATLAQAPLHTSEAAVGRALGQAQASVQALDTAAWSMFDAMRGLQDGRRGCCKAWARCWPPTSMCCRWHRAWQTWRATR